MMRCQHVLKGHRLLRRTRDPDWNLFRHSFVPQIRGLRRESVSRCIMSIRVLLRDLCGISQRSRRFKILPHLIRVLHNKANDSSRIIGSNS